MPTLDEDARNLIAAAQDLQTAIRRFQQAHGREIGAAAAGVAADGLPDASPAQRASLTQFVGGVVWRAADQAAALEQTLQELRQVLTAICPDA